MTLFEFFFEHIKLDNFNSRDKSSQTKCQPLTERKQIM